MIRRILIANPYGIGDVLFTTPVVRSLREAFPRGMLGYLCNRRVEPLVRNSPHLNAVFVFEKDEHRARWRNSRRAWGVTLFGFLREIRKHRFDTLIDFSLGWHYSFVAMLLGIRRRIGFNYRGRGRFLTKSLPLPGFEGRHVAEYYLDLLGLLEISPPASRKMELVVSKTDQIWADDFLRQHAVPEGAVLVGISPGGGASWGREASYKHWPGNHFKALADRLLRKGYPEKRESSILLFGDEKELAICEAIAGGLSGKVILAAGRTHVGQLSALVERCRLFIGNDGGILHIAVALGVPTLSFYGPVDPAVYGPFPEAEGYHRVLTTPLCCRPCYRRFKYPICERQVCLEWVTPEEAFEEARHLLETFAVAG